MGEGFMMENQLFHTSRRNKNYGDKFVILATMSRYKKFYDQLTSSYILLFPKENIWVPRVVMFIKWMLKELNIILC